MAYGPPQASLMKLGCKKLKAEPEKRQEQRILNPNLKLRVSARQGQTSLLPSEDRKRS